MTEHRCRWPNVKDILRRSLPLARLLGERFVIRRLAREIIDA